MTENAGECWHFGDFALNLATSELTQNGAETPIEPQSLRVLEYLIRNRDRVVTRGDLVTAIWHGRAVSDWAISGALKAVRLALGDTGPDRQFVRTVHSRGYRFVAEVSFAPLTAPLLSPAARPTLLVRPFRTNADSADMGYLAEGLTEDLITSLSSQGAWRVLSYNTSRALADVTPPEGVTNIIDGSLRQLGTTIRVNVATLDGTGTHQNWAKTFDLTTDSLLAGHKLISARIAAVLSPGHRPAGQNRKGTDHPGAHDHYLKGRYAYFRYEPAAFVEALAHFEQATRLDPAFCDAFAQQSYCRTTLFVFGLPGADTTLDRAEALARKAIALDDTSALAHARLGWILGYCGRPEETVKAFEAALARDPDSADVYHAYGETMNRLAQPDRASQLLDMVFSKDSYFPPSWEFPQGHARVLLGDLDRAIAHFRSVLERVERFIPARVQLARAYWEAGDQTAAAEMVASIRSIAPKYGLAHANRMFPYPVDAERARLNDALTGAGL